MEPEKEISSQLARERVLTSQGCDDINWNTNEFFQYIYIFVHF